MIKEFEIKNFRGFNNLALNNLKPLNIIIGKNNIGKTALLEALFLHIGSNNPELPLTVDTLRGIESRELKAETIWAPIFYNFLFESKTELISVDKMNRRRKLEIYLDRINKHKINKNSKKTDVVSTITHEDFDRLVFKYYSPKQEIFVSEAIIEATGLSLNRSNTKDLLKGIFVTSHASGGGRVEAERYSSLDLKGQQEVVLNTLKIVEPKLKRLSVVSRASNPMIYGDIGLDQLIPIQYLGGGISKLITLVLAISEVPNGIVLIDEMENGLHYSIINDTIESLLYLMNKFQVQIFMTTHSLEFIKHIYDTCEKNKFTDYQIIRLDKTAEKIKPTYYDTDLITEAIKDNWDIR